MTVAHIKHRVIAIDFDDVIAPSAPATISYYNRTYHTSLGLDDIYRKELDRWKAPDRSTITARIERYLATDEYKAIPPLPDAIQTIRRLGRQYELHVITGRSSVLEAATKDTVQQYFPGVFQSVEFTGLSRAGLRSKADVCQKLNVDVLIDDHPDHVLPVAQQGIAVLLFGNYPWNQTQVAATNTIRRVSGWKEVAKVLLGE